MRGHRLWWGFIGLSAVACGPGWHQPAQLLPGPLPVRKQVQIWSSGQAQRWHSVVVQSDSISGVPFLRAPECDSCRIALPLESVDSVRIGSPEAGFWKTLGLVVGIPALVAIVLCGPDGTGCYPET
jgi:hypothetical protein